MTYRWIGVLSLSLIAALAAEGQTRKPAAGAKTATGKQVAKPAAAKPAAKSGQEKAPGKQGEGSAAQVYTPTLPPLPEGAVQFEANAWRVTEKDGKAWIYRRTPFGFSRYQEGSLPAEEPLTGLVAADKGDTVEFQRKTPFGVSKWTKKKDELDANELAALKKAASGKKDSQE
ncbi:MAG: hypothetical protein IT164_04450 [Bryobacterales bacterium]|nr:hypothetical protein [Bryobacterales bacterium]